MHILNVKYGELSKRSITVLSIIQYKYLFSFAYRLQDAVAFAAIVVVAVVLCCTCENNNKVDYVASL